MTRKFLLAAATAALLGAGGAGFAQEIDDRDLTVVQNLFAAVTIPGHGTLRTTAWVDHENNRYRLGEPVRLFVRANKDAYFTVVSVGPSGGAALLFPNALQPSMLVKANQTLEIPGKGAPAAIMASGQPGIEFIRVIASTAPLDLFSADALAGAGVFREIVGGGEKLARDLSVVAVPPAVEIDTYDKKIRTVGAAVAVVTPAAPVMVAPAAPVVVVPAAPVVVAPVAPVVVAPAPVAAAGRPPVLVATDKPTYKIGETITLAVTTLENCYLWVINGSSDGSYNVLFPNMWVKDNRVAANTTTFVSGGSSTVKVIAAGPAGAERIYALCGRDATPPVSIDTSTAFSPVDTAAGLGKALSVAGPTPEAAAIPPEFTWATSSVDVTE